MKKNTKKFKISSKEDLKQKFDVENYDEIFLIFKNDIYFDENETFEPINFKNKTVYIKGNDCTIFNLNIIKPKRNVIGLISEANNVIIKDLKIKNAKLCSGEICGTLVGKVNNNLYIENVEVESKIFSDAICGGVCGVSNNTNIKSSKINTKIQGRGVLGGVCGMSNTYSERETKIKCHLKSEYKKVMKDPAVGKKVGYLSDERENHLIGMITESYAKDPNILTEDEIIKLRLEI